MNNLRSTLAIVWRIAIPYFRSEDKVAGRSLLAAVIAIELSLVAIDVLVNQWYNRFYNALQDRNWSTFTWELGVFIVSEATLSFLGIGLPSSVVSWGADIAAAKDALNSHPSVLLFPAGALALTVLGFIMLGDVVRDALDPKARK